MSRTLPYRQLYTQVSPRKKIEREASNWTYAVTATRSLILLYHFLCEKAKGVLHKYYAFMTERVTAVTAGCCTQKVAIQPAPEVLKSL
jgi:hypothetical protein